MYLLLRKAVLSIFGSLAVLLGLAAGNAYAQAVEPVLSLAKKERPALLETLKELVSIESGSRDIEGLDRIAALIAARLKALCGKRRLCTMNQ